MSSLIVKGILDPAGTLARRLAAGAGEPQALAALLGASVMLTLAQLIDPPMIDPVAPAAGRMAGVVIGGLFLAPILAYAVAGLVTLFVRVIRRGRPSWLAGRLALFQAMLTVAPFVVVLAALHRMTGIDAVSGRALVFLLFGWVWLGGLRVTETPT